MNDIVLNGQCKHGIPLGNICEYCEEGKVYKEFEIANKKEFDASVHEPDPIPGKVVILDLVKKDLIDRAETGNKKYGTYLMSHNGRDALMDAYQEVLDLAMYLRQKIYEDRGL